MCSSRVMLVTLVLLLAAASVRAAEPQGRYGFREYCNDTKGWYQWDENRNPMPIEIKDMRSEDGKLVIPLRRSLLRFAWNRSWVAPGVRRSAILCKEYGDVDLNRFHYLTCRIVEKGSGVFIGINGFDTKLGWTTGLTVIDLNDYDGIGKGKRNVRIELDLHENSTTFILDEIALVSWLTDEERGALIPAGVKPRVENLKAKRYHGLEAVKDRCGAPLYPLDGQEQVIHRDTATGAVLTRLTAGHLPDYFGEGDIWSADGACIFFESPGRPGTSVYHLATGRVEEAPGGHKLMWSPVDANKLFLLRGSSAGDEVLVWDRETKTLASLAVVKPPKRGGYTEFGMTAKTARVTVAYRETPYAFVIDPKKPEGERVEAIELPTALKGFGFTPDETMMRWGNCYTYEALYKDLKTGKVDVAASFFVGHASGGKTHTVGEFGRHLKLIAPNGLFTERRPAGKIKIWANYSGDVVTDYGRLTRDAAWIITNGTDGDVASQHVMIPSSDPGSILRLTRYFSTYYTWDSATYSRPSPDYTKVIFMQDVLDNPDLYMVYTRRPDPPQDVKLENGKLTWEKPGRCAELAGYNVYSTTTSSRDYVRLNRDLVTERVHKLEPTTVPTFYAVTAVEHSGFEGLFSEEAAALGSPIVFLEAERAQLTPPARVVYDGGCSDFRYVRVTPETPDEDEKIGHMDFPVLKNLPAGQYSVWLRTRGSGKWSVSAGRQREANEPLYLHGMSRFCRISSPDWRWQSRPERFALGGKARLEVLLVGADLCVDAVVIQPADAPAPTGVDPRDTTPPPKPVGLRALVLPDGAVKLNWNPGDPADPHAASDFSHFSVYAAAYPGFPPSNETLIRSVKGTEVTDTGVGIGRMVWYKVVAYDTRMNASALAEVMVRVPGIPYVRTYQVEAHLADHLQTVAGPPGTTYVTSKEKGDGFFEIPVDVPFDGWYRLWLDYTTPFYASAPVRLSVDGKALGEPGVTHIRVHPQTVSFRELSPKTAHLFSDPVRLTLDADTFRLTKGKHVLRLSWKYRQVLWDKAHLTNDPAWRPPAYDPFVRPKLKGRGW